MRPSLLRERAGGSCDRGSVCDIENEPQQTSKEPEGSPPSSAAHSQCNLLNQETQDNTEIRGISTEELLWRKMIEQQQCQQNEKEDEQEDDIEVTSSDDKGLISYCQQMKESPQHHRVRDETIVEAPPSQVCQHSAKSYYKEHEDNEDYEDGEDEDEDVRPPRRRKRCRIDSDTTEIATRKKVHRRSSTIAQAQTCTTRGSSVSRSSPDDTESNDTESNDTESIGADYQEYPLQGFLKCVRIGRETTYNLEFRLLDLPDSLRPSIGLHISNPTSSKESVVGSAHSRVCASHAKRSRPGLQKQRKRGRLQYTAEEDNLLMRPKKKGLSWKEIHRAFIRAFSDRSIGSLQVRYCNELKDRDSESTLLRNSPGSEYGSTSGTNWF
ncbi:hypothetical protein GMDG_03028 [Pseudogymnoascus destructans 20631-21]|uniref:Myb-like domain-containing protein n=1 Tax=Pseudogymnoascus destructans (strain ATCC MYA-4855 / 20631-21) TaxID=658429 RepID=L8G6B9_PSED2|nr:hypothetical protein GMDG_03028 [Pseudogymnoascus destructans 20631-21]